MELSTIFFPAKYHTSCMHYRSLHCSACYYEIFPELSNLSPSCRTNKHNSKETNVGDYTCIRNSSHYYRPAADSFLSDKSCQFLHYRSFTHVLEHSNSLLCLPEPYCSPSCEQTSNNTTVTPELQQYRADINRNELLQETQGDSQLHLQLHTPEIADNLHLCQVILGYTATALKICILRYAYALCSISTLCIHIARLLYHTSRVVSVSVISQAFISIAEQISNSSINNSCLSSNSNCLSRVSALTYFYISLLENTKNFIPESHSLCSPPWKACKTARGRKKWRLGRSEAAVPPPACSARITGLPRWVSAAEISVIYISELGCSSSHLYSPGSSSERELSATELECSSIPGVAEPGGPGGPWPPQKLEWGGQSMFWPPQNFDHWPPHLGASCQKFKNFGGARKIFSNSSWQLAPSYCNKTPKVQSPFHAIRTGRVPLL